MSAFNFCPNISLPENKQRIKEIGIDKFYEEYYKTNFDINPNTNILDKLFVNIDKFSDSQQKSVVNSIIKLIDDGKKEGYTSVDDLFQYSREVFNNTLEEIFKPSNADGSLDHYIQKFQDIDNNWDRFKEKVVDKLKGIGVKVTKVLDDSTLSDTQETSNNPELEVSESSSPEDSFVSTEANYQRNNYDDQFSSSVSSKDTASAHLKLKLSLIPEVEFNLNGKLTPKTNFIGMEEYMDLDKVWTSLQGVLTGLDTSEIYPTIVDLAKENPMYEAILSSIQGDKNISTQNEFIVAFSKQQQRPLTQKISYSDKSGRRTINIFGTNRQGANDIVIADWYDRFKKSQFVKDDGVGNLVVDIEKSKLALESFNNFMKNYDSKDSNISNKLQVGLSSIGLNLSKATIDNLIKYGTKVDGTKYSSQEFLNKYVGLIFKRISGGFGVDSEDDQNQLSYNNPFISETTALTALAKLENITNPFLYESSYVGGDGKPRYSIVNNNYISKLFNKFNTGDKSGMKVINDVLDTTYGNNSIWANKYKNDSKFREDFNFHIFDSLGTAESKITNKSFSKMSNKEKEFTRIGFFQNVGKNTSIFFGPIPSDKTTLPLINVAKTKVVIDINSLQLRNSESINAMYTPFIAEYNRIKDVQSQQEDPKFKDRLIDGYHNDMGEKFLIYDFLNKDKELFDEKGKLKLIDTQTLSKIITPKILDFSKQLIKDQLKYWDKLGIDENKLFDKTYRAKLGTFDNEKEAKVVFASDYAINQFLAHFNYTQLIGGDPALHGKSTIEKTWINYSKRLAKDIAPGLDGNFINPNFTSIFLKDLKYTSKQFNEYQEVLGDKSEAYKNINPADAQEYTTLKEHLAVRKAYGKLSPEQEEAGNRLINGGENTSDIKLILQPEKPVQVGTVVDKAMGINRMYYIKTSSFPLIPALTKGLEIDKLRVAMEEANIDRAVYESGVKLGLGSNTISTEESQGIIKDNINLKDKGVLLNRDGFRIQQETPYHGDSKFINEGSQGRKLILSDVDDDQQLDLFSHNITGKDAKQLYENLHIEKMNRAFNQLISDIGAEKDRSGNLVIKDLSKLQQILLDEATSRNYNINDVYGLQIEEDSNGKQRFTIPLGFNNSSSRLESILNSLFTNRVIKSELPGFANIQGSSSGFSKLRTIDQLNSQIKDSIIWLDPKYTELNYIRKNSDGSKLLQADILVPSWFKDKEDNNIDLTKFIKEDGTLDTERLPEDLLTTIGIRIPTQGLNSMMSFKVKGFLPKIVGDLAIVPPEIVVQMGSDFDVDKLYMYRYHHEFDGNKFTKIQPNIIINSEVDEKGNLSSDISNNNLSKFSNEQLNNSIIQYYEDRYKDVSLLPKILEPNGFGDLPKLANEITNLLNLEDKHNFFTTQAQNRIHEDNNSGKAGTGIFSLFSTFIKVAQDAKLQLPIPITFKVDNKVIRSKSLYSKGYNDKLPSTVISFFQSASVDNAKEQILGSLNINSQTMDVAGTIALAGFDENYISYFISQPIVRDYIQELSNSDDITNPIYNVNREQEAQQRIRDKYQLSNDEIDRTKDYETGNNEDNKNIFSDLDMKNELESPTNFNQRLLFEQYLNIKDLSKQIRLIQSSINTDTSGLGVRYVDLQVKANNIDIVRNSETFDNIDKVFNNTQIGRASEVLEQALKLFSNILPYETLDYKNAVDKITEYMGKADKSSLYADDLSSMYNSLKSFLYSKQDLLNISNVNEERNKLLYGSQALGNRWEAYTKTLAGKKNLLSERIKVRRGTNINEPIRLEAINTPAANNSDNNETMASYYRMYHKGSEEEKQLASDLVNYFILTGAKQGPSSISKYIPYDILEQNDFSNKLHDIDNSLREGENILGDEAIEQYFQHNPSKAIAFNIEDRDIHEYNINEFKIDMSSKYLVPSYETGKLSLVPPTYMSVYNRDIKNFMLYKISKSTVLGSEYSRIDLLGDSYISEYNANDSSQYSIIKNNQSNLKIPENINKRVEEKSELPTDRTTEQVEEIDKNYITKELNLNSTPEHVLNTIANNNSEFSNIANDLKRILVNYPDLKIDTNLNKEGISGQYIDNTISLNLDNILNNSKNPLEKTQRVIIHELLHAITANKINNYSILSLEDKKAIDKLKILYNQYKTSMSSPELTKFQDLLNKYKYDPKSLTNDEIDFLKDNKQKYYALDSLHEFIAAGLTDEVFTQQLKDNNFWSKIWKAISGLLGLNESYNNDYEALYKNTLDLGNIDSSTNDEKLNDFNPNPRDQKQEFLTKYHLYDGKPINQLQFDRINNSMKTNDKYNNIRIDLAWENGQRVLRVFTKGGTPLYDIDPEPIVPKSKEEKIVEQSLKRYYDIRNKFKSNPNFAKNPALQAKVEDINNKIKELQEEHSVDIITSQAKDKLSSIKTLLNRQGLINAHDSQEVEKYLSWYANIRDYIQYNEAFEEENSNLDEISRKAVSLYNDLKKKQLDLFVDYANQEIETGVNINKLFNTPNIDVGTLESNLESGMYSSNQKLQLIQALIRKTKLKTAEDFNKYQDEITPIFKEFQKKYKDYNIVLQLDKDSNPTGRLLNKYSQSYYDELIKRKGNSKESAKFFRENTELKISDKNKEEFESDVEALKESLPDWNKEGSHDKAKFTQWYAAHDPNLYIAKVKKGLYIHSGEREKFKNYVTSTPTNKWLDSRYQKLKSLGEDSIEMKVYNYLDTEFRTMSKKYDNEANYIPETTKDFLSRFLQGDYKGAIGGLTKKMQDAVSVRLEPKVNSSSLDIDGVPNDAIPVYMMSSIMDPSQKSYDLGRVLLASKLQEIMLGYKNEVEPYLNIAKQLIQDLPQYVTNMSGDVQVDENNNPILNHSVTRSPNLNSQSNWMLQDFLYDKGTKQSNAFKDTAFTRLSKNNKGEEVKETRAVAGSKIADTLSDITRLKALGLNPLSSVGRLIWGTISTAIYAGDRNAYGEKEAIKSLGVMLNAAIPGTDMRNKVHTLIKYFDMRVQTNELNFGKFDLKSINNPLADANPYILVTKSEDFIQGQTGIAMLMAKKITDLNGKEYSLFDAFDNKGKWKASQFGPNPYEDIKIRLSLSSEIQNILASVHGDYGDSVKANQSYMLRNLMTMRKWLPRSMSVRFGKEYQDLSGNTQKGRYRSYKASHLGVLPLLKDMYKAFTIDKDADSIDTRNLRMNAYELSFIPVLWGAAVMMKAMVHGMYHDDDKEKAALTFMINSLGRVSGDLTFFFNPYSFDSTIREPIPAFKTIMDVVDIFPAVIDTVEGKGTYKTGIHKGQSKIAVKVRKALPLINQPDKAYSAAKQIIEEVR